MMTHSASARDDSVLASSSVVGALQREWRFAGVAPNENSRRHVVSGYMLWRMRWTCVATLGPLHRDEDDDDAALIISGLTR
jgi:hypothetical protein